MLRFYFILSILLLSVSTTNAFHVLGGELQLEHISDYRYSLSLILFFDANQDGNPEPDESVTLYIFQNRNNTLVDTVYIGGYNSVGITFSQNCSSVFSKMDYVTYRQEIELDPSLYNDEEGYYVVWERCCLSTQFVNVSNPVSTGNTWVLDFPAITYRNESFINSTPKFERPAFDYACVGYDHIVNLRVTDTDGDSLSYRLMIPLNSSEAVPVPSPSPKPHFPIGLPNGYTLENLVPGSPGLSINNKGEIHVRPDYIGFFAYAIEVTEYRDNRYIGRTVRNFHLLVVDCPITEVTEINSYITTNNSENKFEEKVTLEALAGNQINFSYFVEPDFEGSVELIPEDFSRDRSMADLSFVVEPVEQGHFEISGRACFEGLPKDQFSFYVVATTEDCYMPAKDSVLVNVIVDYQDRPYIDLWERGDSVNFVLDGSDSLGFTLTGYDPFESGLRFNLESEGSNPKFTDIGGSIERVQDLISEAVFNISWSPNCYVDTLGANKFVYTAVLDNNDGCPYTMQKNIVSFEYSDINSFCILTSSNKIPDEFKILYKDGELLVHHLYERVELIIFDYSGRVYFSESINNPDFHVHLPLRSGLYLARVGGEVTRFLVNN